MKDKKEVVEFGAKDPDYAARVAAAKTKVPVGTVPLPAMPRFDQPPADPHAGVQPSFTTVLTPEQRADLEKSGQLIPGIGSSYAANQPALRSAPPAPPPAGTAPQVERPAGVSPETMAGLEAIAKHNREEQSAEQQVEQIEKDLQKEEDGLAGLTQSLMHNRKRRKAIEARITDVLSIDDLIVHQEIRQTVPIVPGKVMPTFRSTSGNEELWVKRQMGMETGSEAYITDKFAMMNLCCGLHALNGRLLPTHVNDKGDIDEKAFGEKMRIILKFPSNLLADLSANYVWFRDRLERMTVVDDIKGF